MSEIGTNRGAVELQSKYNGFYEHIMEKEYFQIKYAHTHTTQQQQQTNKQKQK